MLRKGFALASASDQRDQSGALAQKGQTRGQKKHLPSGFHMAAADAAPKSQMACAMSDH